jgi:hypothetical protein
MRFRHLFLTLTISLPLFSAGNLSLKEAIQNGSAQGSLKLYYYDIHKAAGFDSYATSLGGHLQYTTKNWNEMYVRVAAHSSNAVGPKLNPQATFLFNNDNDGKSFTALSESFLGYRRNQRVLKVGNFRLNTPMMNDDKSRIVPWSYRGVAFTSTPRQGFRMLLNYITHTRSYTSDQYTRESASGSIEEGVTMVGMQYEPIPELSLYGFYYHAPELYDTGVLQIDYKHPVDDELMFCMGAQYFKSGNGGRHAVTESVRGGDDIDLVGLRASLETETIDLAINYSRNYGISGITKGYGGSAKVYTTSMIASGRANYKPEAWMIDMRYDLPMTAWGHSEIAAHYTTARVHDDRGTPFDAYYAHLRHFINTDSSVYFRYETVDYGDATSNADFFRIIAAYQF